MKKFIGFVVFPLLTLFIIVTAVVYLKENLAPDDSGAAVDNRYSIAGSVTCLSNPGAIANQAFEIAVTQNGITETHTALTDATGKYALELTAQSRLDFESLGDPQGLDGLQGEGESLGCTSEVRQMCGTYIAYCVNNQSQCENDCGVSCRNQYCESCNTNATFCYQYRNYCRDLGCTSACAVPSATSQPVPTKKPCYASCSESSQCASGFCGACAGGNCCTGTYCTGNPTPTTAQGVPTPTQASGGGTSAPSRTPSPTPTRTPVPSPTPSPYPAPSGITVSCSATGLARFTWSGTAPKFNLRINHDPANLAQCTNTASQNVGWFCGPANCPTCDDRYVVAPNNTTPDNPANSRDVQLTAGQRYVWSIQSVAANGTTGSSAGSIDPSTASFICGSATGPSNTPAPSVAPTNTAIGRIEIRYVSSDQSGITSTATNCGQPVGVASGECGPARSTYKNYNLTRPGSYTTFDFTLSSCPQTSITPTSAPVATASPAVSTGPTVLATGAVAECKPIDINGDGQLNLIDFAEFASGYSQSCTTSENRDFLTTSTCGSADTNADGKIDIVDLAAFASKYYLHTPRCDQ